MRIALVYPFLHRHGGIERYVYELAARLAARHDVTIVTGRADSTPPAGCRLVRLPFVDRPYFLAAFTFSIATKLRLRFADFDIVNAHGASALRQHVVTAHSCHRAWFTQSRRSLRAGSRAWWLKMLNPLHYLTMFVEWMQYRPAAYRRIIAVSASVRRELAEHYRVPEDRIDVIRSGVDCDEFSPANRVEHRAAVRGRFGIVDTDLLLLFVGNEFRRKGLDVVIEALARGAPANARLLVAGRDDPRPFAALARQRGIGDRVIFAGETRHVAPLYAAADIFVMPTRYEAFGLSILEAMASGLPVITTASAGVMEVIAHEGSGLLLDDAADVDAVARAVQRLDSAALRDELGTRARQRAEALSWDAVSLATLSVFDRVLAETMPSSAPLASRAS